MIDGLWLRATLSSPNETDSATARAMAAPSSTARSRAMRRSPSMARPGNAEERGSASSGTSSAARAVASTSGKTFPTINPATGEVLAEVEIAGEAEVERAVAAAKAAQPKWAAMTGMERGRILKARRRLLRERNAELALLETRDTGKPIQETVGRRRALRRRLPRVFRRHRRRPCGRAHRPRAVGLRLHAARAARRRRRHRRLELPAPDRLLEGGAGARLRQRHDLQAGGADAAHARSSSRRSSPRPACPTASSTSSTASPRPGGCSPAIPAIAKVSLTGEVGTGKAVMADAAATLKHVTLELGGKSPLIVFDDADLDDAVSGALLANFYSAGEVCSNGTRVFLHESMQGAVPGQLTARVKRMRIGDPLDPEDPCRRADLRRAHGQGARLYRPRARRGREGPRRRRPRRRRAALGRGFFVAPTVFDGCRDDMAIVREEIFGPVMSVLSFADEDEVIARANATEYGLSAGVFTRDLARAHRVIAKLEAGTCWINHTTSRRSSCPSAATSAPASAARTARRRSSTTRS